MRDVGSCVGLFFCLGLSIVILASGASAQMIADIAEDVETEFGIYHPYPVEITPQANPYVIEPGFANVVNFGDFSFSAAEESLLSRHAFVARPSGYMEVYDVYNECAEQEIPVFVTTDALLHTYHVLYDRMLRTAEERRFFDDLTMLTRALSQSSESSYCAAQDSVVGEALRQNVAYLSVPLAFMDCSFLPPEHVEDWVVDECSLIDAHEGYALSPLFGYHEDYSQYVPRGHYTKSDTLRSYFKAMMWLGRMTFIVEPPPLPVPGDVDSLIRESTRRALLFVHCVENTAVGDESAATVWDRIYRPTVFFVGRTDDLTVHQYRDVMEEVYGEGFASLPVDTFASDVLIDQFILAARGLPDPAIPTTTPKGLRFMGQRFIPDSYILSELTMTIGRPLPKGLDVMSVLGSDRAYQILDEVYHEPDQYPGYAAQMDSLKVEFAALPDATWAQNLYYNWLYSLMPLLFAKGEGYPTFMGSGAWTDKELYTALGSWTELRHDTILYGKQSYFWNLPDELMFNSYVEPNPHLFARLASLANLMHQGLGELCLLFDDFGERISDLEALLLCLKGMAEKELLNLPLTGEEKELLANIGVILEVLVDFEVTYPLFITGGPGLWSEDQMTLVADVHTDAQHGVCLEEGIGYPFNLYVIVEIDGELVVTRGAGFSYFELEQPLSDRLTDEAWREILQTASPDPPAWAGSFVDVEQSFTVLSPAHYVFTLGNHEVPDIDSIVGIEDHHQELLVPRDPQLFQNYPNPFNPVTEIRYVLPVTCHVKLEVFNVFGQRVATLVDGEQEAGHWTARWNGGNCASGLYLCRLTAGEMAQSRTMVLVK